MSFGSESHDKPCCVGILLLVCCVGFLSAVVYLCFFSELKSAVHSLSLTRLHKMHFIVSYKTPLLHLNI